MKQGAYYYYFLLFLVLSQETEAVGEIPKTFSL